MTVLTKLWEVTSFRELLLELAREDREKIAGLLHYAIAARSADNEVVDDAPILDQAQRKYVPVLETILRIRDSEGVSPLISDTEGIGDEEVSSLFKTLGPLLEEGPNERDKRLIGRAQRATLPVAEDLEVLIDFRAISTGRDAEGFKLVPVVKVQVWLDDPIGGSRNLVFQLEDSLIGRLEGIVQRALALREAAVAELPEHVIPLGLQKFEARGD